MFQNYLKIALRHISRNKGYVFINVMGLGIALACCMIAFVNYQAGKNADSFHENYDKLFRITANTIGGTAPRVDVASPLSNRIAEDLSGVEAGVRFYKEGVIIQNEQTVFTEQLALVDPNFLEVFTFNILSGDAAALKDPSKVIISATKAKSYFGEASAVGKTLVINPGQKREKSLVVGAVIADKYDQISSLDFDFLVNIQFMENGRAANFLDKWTTWVNASFLLLKNPNQKEAVEAQLAKYIPERNEAMKWNTVVNYQLQPMNAVFMDGREVSNNQQLNRAVHPAFYWAPAFLAILILFTACLNFTNTTISFSNKRLKEMGVRKVMGSGQQQLIFQLLAESLVICVLAILLGIILAEYLLPYYNNMWSNYELALSLDYFQNTDLILFLLSMVFITTLLGGAYPAFYISSFAPSHIFRGNTKFGGDNWLIRSLLGVQIIISLIAVIGGINIAENAAFQKNHDLGYAMNEVINVDIQHAEQFTKFKNSILENPAIIGVTGSGTNMGFGNSDNFVGNPEDNWSAQTHMIGDDFLKVMGLTLVEGRTFDKKLSTDYKESVLVTQKFAKEAQWDHPIGKKIKHRFPKEKMVIGVVEDFYASSVYQKPRAAVFHFAAPDHFRVMKVRVNPSKMGEVKKYLKEQWASHFPLAPFNSYYQDKTIAEATMITENAAKMYLFLALITVLLSATGLFSLVSLNVLKRAKEIAIRRVLGASPESITYTTNKHYILIFGISGIVGALLGSWVTETLLGQIFEVTSGLNVVSIILSVIGICLVGALTIGSKLVGVLRTNPAETLKSE